MNWAAFQELWVQLGVAAFVVALAGIAMRLVLQHRVPRQHRHQVSTVGLILVLTGPVLAAASLVLLFVEA